MKRRSILVAGNNPEDFARAYTDAYAELEECENFQERFLTDTSMYLFFDDPRPEVTDEMIERIRQQAEDNFHADYSVKAIDPEERIERTQTIRIELTIGVPVGRYCCECENFSYRKGCPYQDGIVRQMDKACALFNVNLGRCE